MIGVMVDLETMGTGSDAAIIAIGAVEFDTIAQTLGKEFYAPVSLESSVDVGMKMDVSTVLWWMKQDKKARKAFEDNEQAECLFNTLCDFSDWYPEGATFWGNGASFDNVILSNAYILTDLEKPWDFWDDRCFRTLKNLYPDVSVPDVGIAHNALDDAIFQANLLMEIYKQKDLSCGTI